MAGTSSPTSSSSSNSCLSIGSFVDDIPIKTSTSSSATIKFLCSHGGRILPRCTDGKLRYVGGDTRVLSVDRSVSFSDLVARMGELCGRRGAAVGLRCQMPTEDLDALVSITSDEDLASLIEEYDLAGGGGGGIHPPKIRAFLHHHHPPPPPHPSSKGKSPSASRPPVPTTVHRCVVHRGRTASVAGRPGHGSHRVQHHHQHHQHQHQHQFPVLHQQ